MLAATASAVATVAVVVSAVTATAVLTAASAAMMLGIEFLGGGVAHYLDISAVAHRLTGELVVEVHEDLVVGDLDDLSLDAHAFLCHHGHTSSWADVLGIKLAVDMEDFFLEFIDELGVLDAEGLLGLECEVKLVALLESHDVILEALDEREVHAEDKGVGVLRVELEDALLLIAVDDEDFIDELYIFTGLNFLHFCC